MAGKSLKEAAAEKLQGAIVVDGISIEGVTPDTLDDFDILESLATMQDEAAGDSERLMAMTSLGPLMFGKPQWARIKSELRASNGGRLTVRRGIEFITDAFGEINAKNS